MEGAGLDASDRDDAINIRTWPVYGVYMPDGMALLEWQGETYILTTNEGDTRDYDAFSEEARVRDPDLDPSAFPNAETLRANEHLGRLTVTTTLGDVDGDGLYEALYPFGARLFSVWSANVDLLYDSGDAFEQVIAARNPSYFNGNHSSNDIDTFDTRSDNKGPEPEDVTIGFVDGVPYAFIVLERIGGVMIYDLSDPTTPAFAGYGNHRDFDADAGSADALDLGAENAIFIAPEHSPTGAPLLVVANEVSGTTSTFVRSRRAPPAFGGGSNQSPAHDRTTVSPFRACRWCGAGGRAAESCHQSATGSGCYRSSGIVQSSP